MYLVWLLLEQWLEIGQHLDSGELWQKTQHQGKLKCRQEGGGSADFKPQ